MSNIMSWNIQLPIMIRTLIDDLSDTPKYSDERLLQIIAVAASYVILDVQGSTEYVIDVITPNITPDPVSLSDTIFLGLVSLKSCCIIDQSTLRTKAALEGIRASLGPASLSVNGSLAGIRMILENGPCSAYSELTDHWDVAQASFCRAIFGPFVGNTFDPTSLPYPGDNRRDMTS